MARADIHMIAQHADGNATVDDRRVDETETETPPPTSGLIQHSSISVEYYTPPDILDPIRAAFGGFDLDPASCLAANHVVQASIFYCRRQDGLVMPWWGALWLNPPYGKLDDKPPWSAARRCFGGYSAKEIWLERLVAHVQAGLVQEAAALVTSATGDAWYEKFIWRHAAAILYPRRIDFIDADGEPIKGQPGASAIAYYGRRARRFARYTHHLGPVVTAWSLPEMTP